MQLVHVYLNFPGTAREAFEYYEKAFGTKIIAAQTFGQASFVGKVPDGANDKIVHIQMPLTETVHLMGSDSLPGIGPALQEGNNFHISVVAKDREEADRVFDALSADGMVTMPIANAPWGPYYGMCRDKFGIQWMVSLDRPA